MARLLLVHWNAAEAAVRRRRLAALGHVASASPPDGRTAFRRAAANPPDAVVIDLSRLPSHGRDVALALRERRSTRTVPLVFLDGEPAKVRRLRALLPDATFATWRGVRGAVARALRRGQREPTVAVTRMSAYAGTPLWKKLGIREGATVAVLGAAPGIERVPAPLPPGARVARGAARGRDPTLLFARSQRELDRAGDRLAALAGAGTLWIAWPKRASGLRSDLTEPVVRAFGMARGLVDYKVCALDTTWAGLAFVVRTRARASAKSGR
jgi:CheY-like chemotaxis protein